MAKGYIPGLPGLESSAVQSVTGSNVDNSDPKNPVIGKALQFGLYTLEAILITSNSASPTYITGAVLFPSSSAEFTLLDAATGLVRNDSGRAFGMQGNITYQTNQGAGGSGELFLWSERSNDDGVTFTENEFSLRTSEVRNNSENSQSKASFVGDWLAGESIRWAMYRTGGTVTLDSPSTTVNGGNVVEGLSIYWQLNEV